MGDSLVCLIIKEDFGEDFAKVGELLLKHGELTLADIVRYSEFNFAKVKHIMIILTKHNLISFKPIPLEPGQTAPQTKPNDIKNFLYSLVPSDVIHRIRFPKITQRINQIYGTLCNLLIIEYLENGRLTLSEAIGQIQANSDQDEYSENEIIEAVGTLIKGSYLSRVDFVDEMGLKGEDINEETKEPEITKSGKRKPISALKDAKGKKVKGKKADQVNMLRDDGLDELMLARLQTKESAMIGINKAMGKVVTEKEEEKAEDKLHKEHPFFKDPILNEEYIYKINFRKFIHDFRTKHVTEIVTNKLNLQAGLIVEAMLKGSQSYSRVKQFRITEPITLMDLMKRLSDHPVLKEGSVKDYLAILEQEEIVKSTATLGRNFASAYSINLELLISRLQHKTLEKIVEERLGEYEARIMRALDRLGYMDEKKIADTCLIPLKEARTAIMKLYTNRYLDRQEVPGKDKGKTVVVYGLMVKQAIGNLLEGFLKTMFNLKKRQILEMEKLENSLQLEEEKDDTLIRKIESAILDLDETIMLYNEY